MTNRNQNKDSVEKTVRDIRRATRKRYSAEEKIRIVLEGLRGEDSIAKLCRREGCLVPSNRLRACPRERVLESEACRANAAHLAGCSEQRLRAGRCLNGAEVR